MRKANAKPSGLPGASVTLTPFEAGELKCNMTRGGYQDLENWLINNMDAATCAIWLDPVMLERVIRCCKKYGPGGPNKRIRSAMIPALRRAGIEVMPEWKLP